MIMSLIAIPIVAGLAAYLFNSNRLARLLLVLAACAHFVVSCLCMAGRKSPEFGGWLELDATGSFFLCVTSLVFLAVSAQTAFWLERERRIAHSGGDSAHRGEKRMPERIFIPFLLLFLSTMTLVVSSRHFGLLWVAVEATTLASAPLICFHRSNRSLEAMWKYLLICSVGIGLALFGSLLLSVAGQFREAGEGPGLSLSALLADAGSLHQGWLKTAFIFILAGYGAKMGLAPFHTWLPDAHSEAPSTVSALLSGSLLNCAFLGILRMRQVCVAAGLEDFCGGMLVAFGILSIFIAAVFIVGQADYKRLLAYSSVEHMGIAALGVGIGGAGVTGSMIHVLNHSMSKAMLFMLAGNVLMFYGTRAVSGVGGMMRTVPRTGVLWLLGLLAITGTPPFGLFISEFGILKAALRDGFAWTSAAYLILLAVAFAGMSAAFLKMALGERQSDIPSGPSVSEGFGLIASPAALCALTLVLGVWMPPALSGVIEAVVRELG